ncbi:hypothetical protein GPECTOR_74g696 [Gonium pectorale]|uniref:ATP-dependent RNA helicase Ski2/MTR4 C-terminal domain-containing protein n=1 Tax=Gonium pectorale TaxID=33097 RepID=A0A150G2I6_GONPE|nr:hypothetical protein GPECTOR_74g696 [Gonium pectorale]|eukprot:KXZ44082.1 hypothetical protein GPECTOR_74g696 [Gonium pectorale]
MPCETIQTRFRPVPLHWHFAYFKSHKGVQLDDLLLTYPNGKQVLHPKLNSRKVLLEEARNILQREPPPAPRGGRGGRGRGGGRGGGSFMGPPADPWDLDQELEALLERDPQSALGTPATIAATRPLQARLPWSFVTVDASLTAAVANQRAALKAAVAELEAQRRQAASGANRDGSLEKMAQAKQLLRKAEKLRADSRESSQLESTWRAFQATMEILICVDAMEAGSLRVLPLGLLARNIQGGNELWLAMALSHPALQRLSGPALAALLGALLSPEVLSKPVAVWAAYPVSPEVEAAVEALEPQRQLLQELQTDAGLSRWNDPLALDLRFAGLVEAWASGATWSQIMSDSNLDDGDMARLLIRTIDLLKQLQHNAHLLPELKEAAAEALRGMDRKPVAELTF